MLSAQERRRLVGALNLLGSPITGERDAAATAVQRIVAGCGFGWEQIIPDRLHAAVPRDDGDTIDDWRVTAAALRRWHAHVFNDVELAFLANVGNFVEISPRQAAWIQRLVERTDLSRKAHYDAKAAGAATR